MQPPIIIAGFHFTLHDALPLFSDFQCAQFLHRATLFQLLILKFRKYRYLLYFLAPYLANRSASAAVPDDYAQFIHAQQLHAAFSLNFTAVQKANFRVILFVACH